MVCVVVDEWGVDECDEVWLGVNVVTGCGVVWLGVMWCGGWCGWV